MKVSSGYKYDTGETRNQAENLTVSNLKKSEAGDTLFDIQGNDFF